jgi:two-component system heavy metal sensor histidine kinase CusS
MVRLTSIRTRLLTALFAGSIIIILLGAGFAYTLVKKHLYEEVDHFLRDKLTYQQIAAVQNGERIAFRLSQPVLDRFHDPEDPDFFQFRFLDGRDIYRSSGLVDDLPLVGLDDEGSLKAFDCNLPNGRRGRCMGMVFTPEQLVERGDPNPEISEPIKIHLVVARDRAEIDKSLRRLRRLLAGIGIAVAGFSLVATTSIVRNALRPMGELSLQIESTPIGIESSEVFINDAPSEIQPVIDRLNHLLGRVATAIENERQFTANAAHELRNPLAGLKSQLELALGGERDPDTDELTLARALSIQEQMEKVVGNLLMLARLDSGREEFEVHKIEPSKLLRQCWKPYFDKAAERNLEVRWNLSDAPKSFSMSPSLFKIMASNLLGNAVSYVPHDGQIEIAAGMEAEMLVISISNSNPGISESDLEYIFKRFQRGDASAAGGSGHAGIGLSLCERIVKTIKGQVVAEVNEDWFRIVVKLPEVPV